ncbi:MAG TPA: SPOR domain-containing protein, partial [Leptospiraceae bacterium]|nr:SPOR domain-containing protein [Leptospiraceae bacterium]
KTDVKKEEKKTETKPSEVKPVEKKAEIKPPRKKKTALKKIEIEDQNFYTLQLGAFSSQEQAQKFKDNVVSESKTGRFSPFVQKNGELFVVRIGKAKDRDEIEKYLKSLDTRLQSTSMVVKNSH